MPEIHEPLQPRFLMSYRSLRRVVGIIGILTPLVLLVGTFLAGPCNKVLPSISHYYYSVLGDFLVAVLGAIGLFLIMYRYHRLDDIATTIAGASAILIALFPTDIESSSLCYFIEPELASWVPVVHYISAALFFLTLGFISFFRFPKEECEIHSSEGGGHICVQESNEPGKDLRGTIYKISGVIILLSVLAIFVIHQWYPEIADDTAWVFYLEWIGLAAFGLSWLIKGDAIPGLKTSWEQ